ncbi:MAG: hypothetical protein HYV60_21685, partial [Planctomycetia bacterium]|nr:hypothetical protein [Planctomycetia bacterium]
MRHFYLLHLMLLISFVIGCKQQVANPSASQPATAKAVIEAESPASPAIEDATTSDIVEPPSPGEPPVEGLATATDTLPENKPAATVAEEAVAGITAEEKPPRERFLLLTRDGPLVIDVVLRIDDEPYTKALEQLVERVMHYLEEDESKPATWLTMLDDPKFLYGQYGNLTPEDADQKTQLIAMYDTNRNSRVDRDELPRFLTRNVGGSRPFSLRSSNEFRGDNRTRSPVRRLVDADHDGAITVEEMQATPHRMFERDADDDEILLLADFKDTLEQEQPPMSNQRRVNAPDTAILIGERTRWGYVSYALQETYAYGERIRADDMPLTPELVALLDENKNTLIDANEVSGLAAVPPHLVLEVAFFDANETARTRAPSIRILSACDSLAAVLDTARQHPNRLSFRLPGADVEFFVNEDPSLANVSQAMDAQFLMLDTDNNGYLDTDEYSGQILAIQIPFEALDADGDG